MAGYTRGRHVSLCEEKHVVVKIIGITSGDAHWQGIGAATARKYGSLRTATFAGGCVTVTPGARSGGAPHRKEGPIAVGERQGRGKLSSVSEKVFRTGAPASLPLVRRYLLQSVLRQ